MMSPLGNWKGDGFPRKSPRPSGDPQLQLSGGDIRSLAWWGTERHKGRLVINGVMGPL